MIDEQVQQAELTVAGTAAVRRRGRRQGRRRRRPRWPKYEPQMRAIAQSGYTGKSQSRVAAFLTSDSAAELVQQMTTLDMIAAHTEPVIAKVAAAQDAARAAKAAADQAAATARAGLAQLQGAAGRASRSRSPPTGPSSPGSRPPSRPPVTTAVGRPRARVAPRNLPLPPRRARAVAIRTALAQVGDPYESGAAGPDAFDCSGLTSYAYAAAGIELPHSSRAQSTLGTPGLPRRAAAPATWSSSTRRSATSASTSATA